MLKGKLSVSQSHAVKIFVRLFIILLSQIFIYLFIYSFLFFLNCNNFFFVFHVMTSVFCNPVGNMETKVSPQIITGHWCVTVITVLNYIEEKKKKDCIYILSAKT